MFDTPKLPEVTFIGGSTKHFEFEVIGKDGKPLDLTYSVVKWVMFPYGNPDLTIYEKTSGSINEIEITGVNTFIVKLPDVETENLRGRFVHRPIVKDLLGFQHIPCEGYLVIE